MSQQGHLAKPVRLQLMHSKPIGRSITDYSIIISIKKILPVPPDPLASSNMKLDGCAPISVWEAVTGQMLWSCYHYSGDIGPASAANY